MVGAFLQLYMSQTCLLDKSIAADSNVTEKLISFSQEVYDAKEMSTSDVFCLPWYNGIVKCTDQGVQLMYGYCATYNGINNSYIVKCPYFELNGHNVTEPSYIRLPDNISELNDYMCGPMNRKGFLCKDCIDGFGMSVTSLGYKCSNCTDVWYGIPLYLAVELIPITLFYLIILIFKVHLTSAPMTLYIFYNQLLMYMTLFLQNKPLKTIVAQNRGSPLLTSALFLFGIWSLDFIHYIVPPFCVSSKFQLIHIEVLGFISIIYPLILIVLTWVCVELHGRNFRLLVLLWRPFHRCFVRLQRGWDTRSDIIDAFSSFFLLSYGKLVYQFLVLSHCIPLKYIQGGVPHYLHVLFSDMNIPCSSPKHAFVLVPSLFVFITFNLLPTLLLVLYPFKLFRQCLFKCKLDSLFLTTFVEKFHGCYRDGLDGGRDMRSFSGLYFFLIFLISIYQADHVDLDKFKLSGWLYAAFLFLASAVLIASLRPYKQKYMNILDTLLLMHLNVVFMLLSREYFPGDGTQIYVIMLVPQVVFGLLLLYKLCATLKNKIIRDCKLYLNNSAAIEPLEPDNQERQPLINPTFSSI